MKIDAGALAATQVTVNADSEWTFDGHTDNTGFTQDWVTISNITNPTGTGSFEIAATANDTYAARSISLKLVNTSKPEKIYYVLNVTQAAKQETLEIGAMTPASASGTATATFTDNTLTVDNDETGTFTIAATASFADGSDWQLGTITGNDAGWLTITKETGGLQIVPTANDTTGDPAREATIVIQNADGSISQTITVKQNAAPTV